jgi:ADP-ribose pyrophosphatase
MLVVEHGGVVIWRLDMPVEDIPLDPVLWAGKRPCAERVSAVLNQLRTGTIPLGTVANGELEVMKITSAAFGPREKWEAWNMLVRGPAANANGYVEFPYFWIGPREVVAAVILPLTTDGQIVLVHQFRHHLRRWTWEVPRGGHRAGESLKDAALREGAEEAGISPTDSSQIISLGRYAPDSGCMACEVELFLATNIVVGKRRVQDGEAINDVRAFAAVEVAAMAVEGELDGYTEGVFSRALLRGLIKLP